MTEANTIHSSHQKTLLVLGAGPKAIAIAAKQKILARLGYDVPRVVIVDRQGVAAHWSGQFGFTDGRQILGTRPEKDIGYPYTSTCWETGELNRKVNKEMSIFNMVRRYNATSMIMWWLPAASTLSGSPRCSTRTPTNTSRQCPSQWIGVCSKALSGLT